MYLSVVVPTKNEKEVIGRFIDRIEKALRGYDSEIIFVDDSTDETPTLIKKYSKRFKNIRFVNGEGGKGAAINKGFDLAKGKYLSLIDADLQYQPEDIPKLVNEIKNRNFDLVAGKREFKEIGFIRSLASSFFKVITGLILDLPVTDTQSGLKVLSKSAWKKIGPLKSRGFEFDLEILYKARAKNLKTGEHKITFLDRKFGKTKISVLKTGFELTLKAIKIRFGFYD